MKRTQYGGKEELAVHVNLEEFHRDLNNVDSITAANIIAATMPSPASPGPPETVIECTAEPSGGLSTVITPHRKSPETVLEALAGPSTSQPAGRGLFTSTPQPKRRRLRIIDEPSDHDSDPDYIPENWSVLGDSDCNSPAQDAPPTAAVPSPFYSPLGPPETVLEALAGHSTSQPARRGLFTSTPQPKRRRCRIIDEPSDHDSDPDIPPAPLSTGHAFSPTPSPVTSSTSAPPPSTGHASQPTPSPVTPSASTGDTSQYLLNLTAGQRQTTDKTVWSRTPCPRTITATKPTTPYTQGPTAASRDAASARDFFLLFVTDDMVKNIVTYTNQRIDVLTPKYTKQDKGSCYHTCSEEILALMGILVESGVKQDNRQTTKEMFDTLHGPLLYRAGASEARFTFLLRALCFDDMTTREERRRTDKMAVFRCTWELFVRNCKENYVPGTDLTVDEQMVGFRGRCPFRYYMSKKPKKYGIKILMACDNSNSYMLNGIVDLGKYRRERIPPGKVGEYYTMKLCEPYLDSNRNVTADNWFTSKALAEELYKRRTTMVGTLRKKGYVPEAMVEIKKSRPVDTSIFLFRQNLTMVSYKPSLSKVVLLLSSKHNTPQLGEKKKPKIIHFYNKTKGGVDVLDNMCSRYSCNRKTQRWSLCLFFGPINIAVVNAFILSKLKGGVKVRRTFMHELAAELVRPWAEKRIQQMGMKRSVISTIKLGFGIVDDGGSPLDHPPTGFQNKRRCAFCHWKTSKQTRTGCAHCKKPVCPNHSDVICYDCQD